MAFAVSVALFAFFWLVGFALLGLLYRRDDRIRTILLAPAVGVLVLIYVNYVSSRVGFTIGGTGWPLGIGLFAAAIAAIGWARPPLPGWRGVPYLAIGAGAFVASGWPLLSAGFAWLGHFNPDAAHYFLDTARLIHQPLFGRPDLATWMTESDWSGYTVLNVLRGERVGSDLLLAWVVAVTGLDGPAAYMPLTVALHISALSAATALIGQAHRLVRLLGAAMLAACALSTVGVSLQLIAQELGLVFLALTCVLLLNPFYRLSFAALWRYGLLSALAVAGFVLSYPEMLPFLAASFLLYHLLAGRELLRAWRRAVPVGALVGLASVGLIAPDFWRLMHFQVIQAAAVASGSKGLAEIFPYLLTPPGLATLWGLHTFYPGGMALLGEQLAIAIGLGLTGAVLIGAAWMAWRREACAVIMLAMAALGMNLVTSANGFGSFKLAMYIQPFLMLTAVLSLCRVLGVARARGPLRAGTATALVALLGLGNAWTQYGYLAGTVDRDWSATLNLLRGIAGRGSNAPVRIGLQDAAMPSLVALYTAGHPTWNLPGMVSTLETAIRATAELSGSDRRLADSYEQLSFDLEEGGPRDGFWRFDPPRDLSEKDGLVVLPAQEGSVLNASQVRPGGRIYAAPLSSLRNVLVQVNSDLGHTHLPGLIRDVGLWDFEKDFAGWPTGMQASGRHLLFEVLNPVPGSRLLLDYTIAGLGQQGLLLPPAAVYGTERSLLPLQGGGAARVLSDPVTPREIGGHYYIAVDLGMDERSFTTQRHGLAALYNTQLNDDPRHIAGFVRNISLLAPEQVATLDPPAAITRPATDLGKPGLLFSGISEDGWAADKAWVQLGTPETSDLLIISGLVSGFSPKNAAGTLRVSVDGTQVLADKLTPGNFDLKVPIPAAKGNRRIEIEATNMDHLPAPDGRLASFHLNSLALARAASDAGVSGKGDR